MEEKKINIDMNLFKISGKTRKNRDNENKEKKIKVKNPNEKKKNDTLKKKSILKMIREHQESRYKKLFEEEKDDSKKKYVEENDNFNKDFKEAKDYLESLTEKNKNSFNKTLKNYSANSLLLHPSVDPLHNDITNVTNNVVNNTIIPNSNITLQPSIQNLPNPKYGCLKNGVLPTYRTFMNQTRKSNPVVNNSVFEVNPKPNGGYREPLLHKEPIKESISENQTIIENKINNTLKRASEINKMTEKINQIKQNNKPKKMKRKKTIRRTYKIGKSKINPKIGVLVSNKTIRSNISTKSQLLKQTPIEEVKKFLIKRGMIKVGSITPNDVLRKMYETSSMMCGEIYNHNPENLLYNYFNDK